MATARSLTKAEQDSNALEFLDALDQKMARKNQQILVLTIFLFLSAFH